MWVGHFYLLTVVDSVISVVSVRQLSPVQILFDKLSEFPKGWPLKWLNPSCVAYGAYLVYRATLSTNDRMERRRRSDTWTGNGGI